MRRLTSKRLLQAASLLLAAITALFAVLWAVRGIRPAVACGLTGALARGDWPAAYACIDLAEYDALIAVVALAGSILTWIASRKAPDTPIGEYSPTPAEHARNRERHARPRARHLDRWPARSSPLSVRPDEPGHDLAAGRPAAGQPAAAPARRAGTPCSCRRSQRPAL